MKVWAGRRIYKGIRKCLHCGNSSREIKVKSFDIFNCCCNVFNVYIAISNQIYVTYIKCNRYYIYQHIFCVIFGNICEYIKVSCCQKWWLILFFNQILRNIKFYTILMFICKIYIWILVNKVFKTSIGLISYKFPGP